MPHEKLSGSDAEARVGELIREARRSRPHLSQVRLAAKVGVSRETICRIENGREASPVILMKLAHELDLDPHDLFCRGPVPPGLAHIRVGEALRTRRREQGLSLAQCGAIVGVSGSTLSRFERGGYCQKLMRGWKSDPFQRPYSPAYVKALGFKLAREFSDFIEGARGSRRP